MGFEVERFVSAVDDSHKCVLCHCVVDNPLQAPCGRVFCSGCILPQVLQYGKCPMSKCCKGLGPGDLLQSLELRNIIENMRIKCDFIERGCKEVVPLHQLTTHIQDCPLRPTQCRNKGCSEILNKKDLSDHERNKCLFRPVGICEKGCGLVVLKHEDKTHSCLDALRAHIANQELQSTAIDLEMRKLVSTFTKHENTLLSQITHLHNEIQLQAQRYQNKLADYHSQICFLSEKIAQHQEKQQKEEKDCILDIILRRQNGTLGFNIMGGDHLPGSEAKAEGFVVSRLTEGGPAEFHGMKLYDHILKVNGQDLSKSSHDQAVEAFQKAQEPIIIEVLRKGSKCNRNNTNLNNNENNTNTTETSPPVPSKNTTTTTTASTQTEGILDTGLFGLIRPPSPPLPFYDSRGLVQPSSRHGIAFSANMDVGLTDIEMANEMDYDEIVEDDAPINFEYEEVTLLRKGVEEKIGLTLCYSSTDDEITDIFVGEIEDGSIASKCGRILEGDQIIKINGVDVRTREQAIQLFADSQSDITLLLAREHIPQVDDGFMDSHQSGSPQYAEYYQEHHSGFGPDLLHEDIEEEGGTTDTNTTENSHRHDKDSGVGRTDESTRNDESSEQELLDNECFCPDDNPSFHPEAHLGGSHGNSRHHSSDSSLSTDVHDKPFLPSNEISAEECEKFQEVLETRCGNFEPTLHCSNSDSSIENQVLKLNAEIERIQLECQEIVEVHRREQQKLQYQAEAMKEDVFRSPRMVPRMGTRMDYSKQGAHVENGDVKNHRQGSSRSPSIGSPRIQSPCVQSPKHTSHSSHNSSSDRSTSRERRKEEKRRKDSSSSSKSSSKKGTDNANRVSLTLELNQNAEESGFRNSMLSLNVTPNTTPNNNQTFIDSERTSNTLAKESKRKDSCTNSPAKTGYNTTEENLYQNITPESLQQVYTQYADIMYTNKANLQHTIQVQQKLFQQLLRKSGKDVQNGPIPQQPMPSNNNNNSELSEGQLTTGANGQQMEWVVKKRADGSRYITRRPVRNKLLKERAKKISEERCGLTTDDDAMSEMKVGRYWNKDERRRHLEKAREHKRKKDSLMQQKLEPVRERDEGKKEPNIMELSHKKMMKHKHKKMFDDFTTVQEIMAHGVKEGKQGKPSHNPLLSVTTV